MQFSMIFEAQIAIGYRGQRFFTEAIRHGYNPGPDSPPPRPELADMDDVEALRPLEAAPEAFATAANRAAGAIKVVLEPAAG